MAAEDVAKALIAMRDDAVRAKVGGGDDSPLQDLSLDGRERALVRAAAGEEWGAEVSGFDAKSGLAEAIDYCGREGLATPTAEELDREVVGFAFDLAIFDVAKCKKCEKAMFDFRDLGLSGDPALRFQAGPTAPGQF